MDALYYVELIEDAGQDAEYVSEVIFWHEFKVATVEAIEEFRASIEGLEWKDYKERAFEFYANLPDVEFTDDEE